jgi:acyl dehydratase
LQARAPDIRAIVHFIARITMAIVDVEHARDLAAWSGRALGTTPWRAITQTTINAFADLTGDDHWIHVDPDRAARELDSGYTIAHGLLLLSLIPALQRQIFHIRRRGSGLNYGYDRVRFVRPVPCNARVRLAQTLVEAKPAQDGTRLTLDSEIELENSDKPAVAARSIVLIMDEPSP